MIALILALIEEQQAGGDLLEFTASLHVHQSMLAQHTFPVESD